MWGAERLRRWWGLSIALGAFGCLVATGFVGLNFGFHWDEHIQLALVNRTLANHTLLPSHFYDYPSVTYLLSLIGVLPRVITGYGSHTAVTRSQFYLPARGVFLVATALGGIWLYLALRRRAGELGAGFGAATYLLSFQLAYHARWIAPDAVLASAVALFLWFLVLAWDSPSSRFRTILPAVAAGVATATKYQGAVLMIPVIVLFAARWRRAPATWSVQLRGLLRSVAAFLVTFLVLTPGAILQHNDFVQDIRNENRHYRTGHADFKGALPYDVTNHYTYFWRQLRYVLVLPSHSPLISYLVIAFAILGIATLARREPWFALSATLPCLLMVLYFSTLVVFIVRNFLILLPFLAFFTGIGVGRVAELARAKLARALVGIAVLVVMIVNGAYLAHAAQTIRDRSPAALVRGSDSFMRDRPSKHFVLSRPMLKQFLAAGETFPSNARARGGADYFVVLYSQIELGKLTLRDWPASEPGTYQVVGPLEVDFDYYPTWAGADRVLFLTPKDFARFGLTRPELRIGPAGAASTANAGSP